MIKPILIDIPMPIETPRLTLRPSMPGDGAELNAAILETFDDLHKWMGWADNLPSIEESEEYVRQSYAKWILREDLQISIFDRDSGKLAGSTRLHRIDWNLPSFEIGYWLRKSFVGKGYATESTHALTRFAFLQLNAKRVELRCDSANERSLAVFKRLSFEFEGSLKNSSTRKTADGVQLGDTLIYARTNVTGLPELKFTW